MSHGKLDLKEGDKIRLIGPSQDDLFTVLSVDKTKEHLRAKSQNGVPFRIHISRISEVIKQDHKPENKAEIKTVNTSKSREESKMTDKANEPKVATTTPAVIVKKKEKADKKKREPFDVEKWVSENGGIHLTKQVKFDHPTTKCFAHICIDEKGGFYHIINTYKYENGLVSLGKKGLGGAKFALKGHRITKSNKKGTEKTINVGKLTAAELIAQKIEKDQYKLISGSPAGHAAPAQITAPATTV